MVLKHFDSEFGISIKHFIGDGDSSVHKILNDAFIYKTITKIECRNHLIRNFGTKLIGIVIRSQNLMLGIGREFHQKYKEFR